MTANPRDSVADRTAIRIPLLSVAAGVLALALILLGASGAFFGPMDGDIPWPATAAEQRQFDTARALQSSGVCAVVAASLLIGLAVRVGRALWAVVSLFVFGLAGLGVFFAAFAVTGGLPD